MKNFKVVAQLLVGYFWLVMKMIKKLLILIATLATTEVSVGALAKADQKYISCFVFAWVCVMGILSCI